MIERGIIIKTRKVGKSVMFKLNKENPFVKELLGMDKRLMLGVIEKASEEEAKKLIKKPVEV